jgi:hypothetical protein
MNKEDFEKFFEELKVFEPCSEFGYDSYFDTYSTYFNEYQEYLKGAKEEIGNNKKLIVLFLESGPVPFKNYIFSSITNEINYRDDSFLWNICTGFGLVPSGKKKEYCLKRLYSRKIPVLIIDLFPFHGIKLSQPKGNPYRRQILEEFKSNNSLFVQALKDPIDILSGFEENEKIFLFGVPGSFWNSFGGAGEGSVCLTDMQQKSGPLGRYSNKTNVVNVGGQTISSAAIKLWCKIEGV